MRISDWSSDVCSSDLACRRILDRHPTAGPLWWLCARVLTAPDGSGAEAWRAVDDIQADTTPAELAFALPEDATVCAIGWPELVGEALLRPGDVEVLAVAALGAAGGPVRRLAASGVDAIDEPRSDEHPTELPSPIRSSSADISQT